MSRLSTAIRSCPGKSPHIEIDDALQLAREVKGRWVLMVGVRVYPPETPDIIVAMNECGLMLCAVQQEQKAKRPSVVIGSDGSHSSVEASCRLTSQVGSILQTLGFSCGEWQTVVPRPSPGPPCQRVWDPDALAPEAVDRVDAQTLFPDTAEVVADRLVGDSDEGEEQPEETDPDS